MKTEIRLGSVVPHGVGGPESAALDIIFMYLLHEFQQDVYKYISVNQIGNDLSEFVMKEPGNKIHVNIRYPAFEDFESRTIAEKNRIRLDIIHSALLKVAEHDKKLDIDRLIAIKERILERDFAFEFVNKTFAYKKNKSLTAKIIIQPEIDRFNYYVVIEENKKEKCRVQIYSGRTVVFFGEQFFFYGKWKNDNELVITGKKKEVEVHIIVNECKVEYINLTSYPNPPLFTMMRADISQEEREKARKDWKHSLPPSQSAILDYEAN